MKDLDLFINNNKVSPYITGNTIEGLEVLAQRVIVVLNTRLSEPLRDQEGCSFMSLFGSSQADNTYVYLMISSVISELLSVMTDNNPDDFSLHSIDASDIGVNGDTVTLTLTVTSKSGSTYSTETTIGGSL